MNTFDDRETASRCNVSSSTVRNYKYQLKQKEYQSKIFLALMTCLKSKNINNFINIHRRASMVDMRYKITEEERDKYLKQYFPYGQEGKISEFPKKEKRKIVILSHIISRFEINRNYTEKEINEILKTVFHDYVTIRRYLIEYGFMERKPDCSSYWVKT
jgi:hypothetical protein